MLAIPVAIQRIILFCNTFYVMYLLKENIPNIMFHWYLYIYFFLLKYECKIHVKYIGFKESFMILYIGSNMISLVST